MACFLPRAGSVLFGNLVFLILGVLVSVAFTLDAQEPLGADECEGHIAFSKHVYEVVPDIYLLDVDSSEETLLTNSGNGIYVSAEQPSWSPQGQRIVFSGQVSEPPGSSAYNVDIFAMDANGSRLERLTYAPSNEIRPVFSSDGSRIAFATDRDRNWEIYQMNSDGSEPVNLTNSEANEGERGITWSPDETWIAFVTDRGKGQAGEGRYEEQQIYLVDSSDDLQSGHERRFINLTEQIDICPAGEFYSSPAWSNTGQSLAFALSCGELYDVYVVDVVQSGDMALAPVNLTEEGEISTTSDGFLGLSWSPDDQQLVYVSSPKGQGNYGGELLVVNVDEREPESRQRQLTHYNSSEVFVSSPAWQPCQLGE